MKQYLIFDLDGTLINSSGRIKNAILWPIQIHTPQYFWVAQELFGLYWNYPLQQYLKKVYDNWELERKIEEEIMKEFQVINNTVEFFPWVLEKIHEISKRYKLFLTTASSTKVAQNVLKTGGIMELFEIIYGSEQVPKSESHLEYFKDYSCDEDFYKKAVYIWDGNNDRILAGNKNIDFIHIWNDKKDIYEIESVADIDTILKLLN